MLPIHDPFLLACFCFASFIARTFFMILRNVALSAALSVVLAIGEILLRVVKIANANFDARTVL